MRLIRPLVLPMLFAVLLAGVSVPMAASEPIGSASGEPNASPIAGANAYSVTSGVSDTHAVTSSGSDTYTVTAVRNTTGYLTIDDGTIERTRYGTGTLDVAGAVALDAERLHGRYESLAFENAFASTTSKQRRVELLQRQADRIAARIDTLQDRQGRALREYNADAMSTRRFLRELATVDAAAERLQSDLTAIRRRAATTGGFTLPNDLRTRFDNHQADLVALEGPVRSRLADSLAGERPATTVYIVTSGRDLMLATTTDQHYVREAYLGDERVVGGVDRFGQTDRPRISVAYQRAANLYPWAFENALAPPSANGFGNTSVYQIDIEHTQGDMTTYLDGTTRNAYRETQRKRLADVPTTVNRTTTETLTLRVNRTYPTGPMHLTITRTDTDEPVNAAVRVDGYLVGHTGRDGSLWAVTPPGTVRINATTVAGEHVRMQFAN
ncbi:MAG: hypothetical protein ABEI96_01980 [Haloarculaceae archaeon]